MPLNHEIVRRLGVSYWPVFLRHPVVKALLKRKKLRAFPFRTRLGRLVYDGDAANLIDYHVLTRGGFEPGLDRLFIDWSRYRGSGNDIFLDVGANSGLHTIQLSPYYGQVHAFEPYPPMFERLQHSVRINAINNVVLHQVALSNQNGEVLFRVPEPGNTGTGTMVEDDDVTDRGRIIRVQAATGDGFFDKDGSAVSAIKIDVEGREKLVLEGLQNRIRQDRPLLVFEVLRGGDAAVTSFSERLPDDYLMFLLKDIKRSRYAVEPWNGEAGDIVALSATAAKQFFGA